MGLDVSLLVRYLPEPVNRALRHWCYPAVLMARHRRVRLTRLQGASRTGQAVVLVAGPDPWAYDLPCRFFPVRPQQIAVGEVPVWQLGSVLEELAPNVDMVVARVDKLSARLFFPSNYLRVPEWIGTALSVPEDVEALVRSNHSLREDMRIVRHNRLQASVSQRPEDFDEFYHSMYVPFIRARHGAAAWATSQQSLRNCFRRGGIIWLTQAGERVAGILFEQAGHSLRLWAEGTRDGDVNLMRKGAVPALFFHAISLAIERHCRIVDFGGCRACLSDGVLRYKRKWGMTVRVRPANQFYMLVRWAAWNTAVATFLTDVPLLHQDAGRLTAVTAAHASQPATQADAERIYQMVRMPGIDRIVIVNAAGWPRDILPPPSTVLVGGGPLPAQLVTS